MNIKINEQNEAILGTGDLAEAVALELQATHAGTARRDEVGNVVYFNDAMSKEMYQIEVNKIVNR